MRKSEERACSGCGRGPGWSHGGGAGAGVISGPAPSCCSPRLGRPCLPRPGPGRSQPGPVCPCLRRPGSGSGRVSRVLRVLPVSGSVSLVHVVQASTHHITGSITGHECSRHYQSISSHRTSPQQPGPHKCEQFVMNK